MSDTTVSAVRRLRQDSPTVDAVCRQLERQVELPDAALVVSFAEILFSKAPPEFLRERSPDDLAHMALGTFNFLQDAHRGAVAVEITNPDVENEGWYAPVTVVRTRVSERPFIVDTIREFLHRENVSIEHMVYPVLHVDRDAEGRVVAVRPSREGERRESLVHCEVGLITDPQVHAHLKEGLTTALQQVVQVTDDFDVMIDAVNEVAAELPYKGEALSDRRNEMEETQAFLRWLRDGGFVFLGYRGYRISEPEKGQPQIAVEPGSGLGLLKDENESHYAWPVRLSELDPGLRERIVHGPLLIISKTNAESHVHRRARMDYIGIKKLSPEGEVVGEHRFLGLFTSKAYAEDAEHIPILRHKLHQILDEAGVREGSHDYKEIITIFNSLPKEELFLTSAAEIGADILTVLNSYNTSGVRVSLREDPLHRGVSVMVILPKDRFSGDARQAIERALVSAFDGAVLNYHLSLGSGDQARLHFYIAAPAERLRAVDTDELEQTVERLIRSWADRVGDGLERARPLDEAHRMARRYGQAFSAEYQAATDPASAVDDILEIEAMRAEGRGMSIRFSERPDAGLEGVPEGEAITEVKVYVRGERLILSDFMPILENSGLRVVAVTPFDVTEKGEVGITLYAFAVQDAEGRPVDIRHRGAVLAETILAVKTGDALNDALNKLVLGAGLHWREVEVLRAYAAYAFQAGAVPSRTALSGALVKYPGIARELFDMFETRFDPGTDASREDRLETAADIRAAFLSSLGSVSSLAEDRALRRLEALISGTLRTNYYRRGGRTPSARSGGVPWVSFKFSARDIDFLRHTHLLYEVWVHSARMEGVHLRGSRVARGGIRWSDRPDDFRTEILGLVKTQMVKNAVIVPGGSKGGFVCRRHIADPEARFEEGREQYRTLMRGLLDVTDNLTASGETVPPPDVVAFDDPDPYLVVAADKGTATFSDTANAISAEYGFWLDDAFASGGSHGYDHKAVGITAGGGWECVKRHFRELGKDIQREPFTVAGVGDMSGDVFGNGMLLSEQTRLIAAFDHRHVFIDPDPDPATSFAERRRMFDKGRSSWDDYDRSALSEGGMIIPRSVKEVELTPQARAALGLADDAPEVLDAESLIRAVLLAPVELLWNGGIGTYVKASGETHADAGDPSNDAVRVDTPELRCKVVGEGGNLGFTQAARIEFALMGGRINTDALDNSGGVDMSDHEVNLKILLAPAVASGAMSADERNGLLAELTDSVARLVLDDNRYQSLAVSLDEQRAGEGSDDFRDLMVALEHTGELDRASETLPTTDVLVERAERGESLTRPELCVLLAYSKLFLKTRLLRGGLPDDPVTESYLLGYFPATAVQGAGPAALTSHRLRREIIAGQLANDLVDLMGATFVNRVMRDTGRSAEEVVRAWLVASRLAEHRALLRDMERQESAVTPAAVYRWLLGLARVLERTTRWVLQNVDADTSPATIVNESIEGLAALREGFGRFVAGDDATLFRERVREIRELGSDPGFSERLITLRFLDQLLEVLRIARETGTAEADAGAAFYQVSEAFEVPWLRGIAFASAAAGPWDQRAAQALSEDLSRAHRQLVGAVLRDGQGEEPGAATAALLRRRQRDVQRFREIVSDLRDENGAGLAAAAVAIRELAALAEKAAG
ncbi:MAG: NAD-glutamate dehydrogenase [Gemmatimonadetes bacterium]|nr:NAD-glutamate dehydrogenase [Gemmatimonadota bacterium]